MDVTTLVIEAQDARSRMQEAKKRIKAEVRRKYEAAIKRETEEATVDAEVEFARTLARVHAAGVPQNVLRREVLRTNVWHEWTKWRDLAEIEPERVSVQNAKAAKIEAERPYRWDLTNPERPTLTWLRDDKGDLLTTPIFAPVIKAWRGKFYADEYSKDAVRSQFSDPFAFARAIDAEVKRAYDAGEIGEVLTDYDRMMLENEENNA